MRGTPVYMAPEIMVKTSRLKSASLEDLKKVDGWALGLVMFNLVNPGLKHPFQLDLVKDLSAIEQVEEFLRQGKKPNGSKKYKKLLETIWLPITNVYRNCTEVDPTKRPTAMDVKQVFQSLLCRNIPENVAACTKDRKKNKDGGLNNR